MNCGHHWRKCKCGEDIHRGQVCSECGGDPWGVRAEAADKLDNIQKRRGELLDELESLHEVEQRQLKISRQGLDKLNRR